ncbi:MAG: J domain-containing protein, partial [Chthoniobacteraceae bacterium]
EWKRFEQQDKIGFERWKAATFGGFLTRVREIETLVREKESLIREVEMEMLAGRSRTPRSAYASVLRRRNSPEDEAASAPREEDEDVEGPSFEDLSEIEQELLFEDFLSSVLGMKPDRMSDARYEKMFADFKARARGKKEHPEEEMAPAAPKPDDLRMKEIYRVLVRRLHPDTRADSDEEVSALWHEVQEAYSTGNVERLEMLLALTELQSNETGEHTSLFQMRSVLVELRRAYDAIQKNLRGAKQHPAWNFWGLRNRSPLEKRVRDSLKSMLQWNEWRLRQLEAEIASWSPPPRARKNVRRQRASSE